MLQAYNVIANGGVYVEPKLVQATIDKDGQRHDSPAANSHRVVSAKTANEVRDMMVAVVNAGTGKLAAIDGYTVGGKTGTARKPSPNGGYRDGAGNYHYVATFAGFTPAEDPSLSAIVVLDEPSNDIYASDVSAPVFSRIVAYGLRRFAVPPPGVALQSTVPAPKLTAPDTVVPADDEKVKQAPAHAPTTTTTTTTTVPAATGPPGKRP
jgi:cell division protein FtsI (penicillin-binding protein 3)